MFKDKRKSDHVCESGKCINQAIAACNIAMESLNEGKYRYAVLQLQRVARCANAAAWYADLLELLATKSKS